MRPRHRSRSWKRKAVRTPGGETKKRFEREGQGTPRCPSCGQELHGVSFEGSKTEKKTSRPFGGTLCSACMREILKQEAASTGVLEKGAEAVKIAGRNAGEKVKILSVEENFAVVESRNKKRKVNLKHLEPI